MEVRSIKTTTNINRIKQKCAKTANEIGAEGACALSEALKVNTTLRIMSLGCMQQRNSTKMDTKPTAIGKAANKIGVQGACALSEALKVNTTLEQLFLWSSSTARQKWRKIISSKQKQAPRSVLKEHVQ